MRGLVSIAVIVVVGVILGDLLAHPTSTNNILNGLTNLWSTAVKGAAGAYSTPGQ
jgi:hypothetical protein